MLCSRKIRRQKLKSWYWIMRINKKLKRCVKHKHTLKQLAVKATPWELTVYKNSFTVVIVVPFVGVTVDKDLLASAQAFTKTATLYVFNISLFQFELLFHFCVYSSRKSSSSSSSSSDSSSSSSSSSTASQGKPTMLLNTGKLLLSCARALKMFLSSLDADVVVGNSAAFEFSDLETESSQLDEIIQSSLRQVENAREFYEEMQKRVILKSD